MELALSLMCEVILGNRTFFLIVGNENQIRVCTRNTSGRIPPASASPFKNRKNIEYNVASVPLVHH